MHQAAARHVDTPIMVAVICHSAYYYAIYVDPKHWRRGVGQRLWGEVEDQLRRSGFSDVTLLVLKDNVGALAFYRSNRFVVDGIEKTVALGGAELVEIRLRKGLDGLPPAASDAALAPLRCG